TQMEAMSFGCVPVVRKTGGLADTVEDYDPVKNTGTGFVFEKVGPMSLMTAIVRAYQSFQHKKDWQELQLRAMQRDFSWHASAKQYVALFEKAMKIRGENKS
ncbi:MAG: starch synthase, partial [bacterium]|nr:starch synthase [bacterium]